MSAKLLHNFISILLSESAKTVADAQSENLALYVGARSHSNLLVLYNPDKILKSLRFYKKTGSLDFVQEPITGMMCLNDTFDNKHCPAWNAYEVTVVAAQKGWGPLLFDIAMTEFETLMIDRSGQVSVEARNLWRYYLDSRNDVEKLRLDDYYHPRTKNTKDDTRKLYNPDTKNNFMNYAFRAKSRLDVSSLKKNHEELTQSAKKINSKIDIESFLEAKANSYFSDKYSNVSEKDKYVPDRGLLKK